MSETPRQVLSQEEIDALIQGVDAGKVDTTPPPAPGEVRAYDLASRDRLARGGLPTLELIDERFARHFRQGLFKLLRRPAELAVKGVETIEFSEYLQSLLAPSNLNLVRLKPLRGTALAVFDPTLVYAAVDTFFGGDGRFPVKPEGEGREFTPTELRVTQLILQQLFADLRKAWAPVLALEPQFLGCEIDPQFANVVAPADLVVVNRFHVALEGGSGDFHLTIPYAMLEPVRELLGSGVQGERPEKDERWAAALREQLPQAAVEVSSTLAEARLSLRDLMGLKPGDVIPIDLPRVLDVCVEELPVFRGSVGVARGHHAIKITEIIRRPPASRSTH